MSQVNMVGLTDPELVNRVLRGESDAYGVLYDRYVDAIYRYVYFHVSDAATAEDLTEMVFLKTYETLHRCKNIDDFSAWLYRCAHNLIVDHYRTRKNHVPLDEMEMLPDQAELPESSLLANEEQHLLREAFRELPRNLQQVIACRFVSGLSYAETAGVMDLREDHLRVLQHRALTKLRQEIEQKRNEARKIPR